MSDLKIIFQDEEILVIDKPPGIVVTPAGSTPDETISDILIKDFKINLDRGGVVHRLDKDTSGVLIIAKTQSSLENLQSQFKDRVVKKQYLALVHGFFPDEKTVTGAILRNPKNREKFIISDSAEGKQSETLFKMNKKLVMPEEKIAEVFEGFNKIQIRKLDSSKYNEFSLIDCFPFTGRTHQIRVHLKHLDFPIVSDEKYGGRKTVRLDHRFCKRQFLHAQKLEINHPQTGERIEFKSELPEDLVKAFGFLRDA